VFVEDLNNFDLPATLFSSLEKSVAKEDLCQVQHFYFNFRFRKEKG